MPGGYWWQCDKDAHHTASFHAATGSGIVAFLHRLAQSDWNGALLANPCRSCGGSMGFTYEFPQVASRTEVRVRRIVGIRTHLPGYLPMMWESMPAGGTEPWFDFKYVLAPGARGNSLGLKTPAVFSRSDLAELFATYRRIAGVSAFP